MKTSMKKRVLALALAALMIVGLVPTGFAAREAKGAGGSTDGVYTFESASLEKFAAGAKADGDEAKAGTDDYFTIYYSTKTKVDTSYKTWTDGYETGTVEAPGNRLNFGGKAAISDTLVKNAIKFTTSYSATVKVWWVAGDVSRNVGIFDSTGTVADKTNVTVAKNDPVYSEFTIETPGTYYLGAVENNNYFFKIEVVEDVPKDYTFESSSLEKFAAGAKADGDEAKAGTDDYFTIYYSTKTKVDTSYKAWSDGYETGTVEAPGNRLNFGGKAAISDTLVKNAIKFTTNADNATVKVWWVAGDVSRNVGIFDSTGTVVDKTNVTVAKNDPVYSEFTLATAGTYYLGAVENNNYFFKVVVTDGATAEKVRAPWADVADPVIGTIEQSGSSVTVPVSIVIGDDGADSVSVECKDADGNVVATKVSTKEGSSASLKFDLTKSGSYTFVATASRKDETDKVSAASGFDFVLPLAKPTITSATSKGNGKVEVSYIAVAEATGYVVEYSADGTTWTAAPETTAVRTVVSGLTVGTEYSFRVKAVRGMDSSVSDVIKETATADAKVTWGNIAYGNGITQGREKITGNAADGSVTIDACPAGFLDGGQTTNGKLVPASYDGIVYHYTTVPVGTNFTLKAKVTVDNWIATNGQEGFGLIATDKLGGSGWNNSYSAMVTKCEYYWNEELGKVSTSTDDLKVTNKIGIIAQEKKGLTKDNIAAIEGGNSALIASDFKTTNTANPLDKAHYGIGGNLIGNCMNTPSDTVEDAYSEMILTIQKNNTGYFISYTDKNGNTTTKKFYVPDALEKLDTENVYVGFFSARSCKVTFSDIEFTTIPASEDDPAEEKEYQKVAVNASVQSSTATGVADHDFLFTANCDGWLSIQDGNHNLLVDSYPVKAGKSVNPYSTTLVKGNNKYFFTFVPDKNYRPDADSVMESYDWVIIEHTVKFKQYGKVGESLWVAPNATGSGTKANPMSIYDAVKYVQPGQQIILKEGTYNLESTVKVARGVSGTADAPIVMMVDPDAKTRPVLNFQGLCAGMIFGGDYWYVQGFDVIGSANGQKAVQVSGNNNTLDNISAHDNGSTGIQISRLFITDEFENWPANNLILNCTSYFNHDEGDEDADGFAAKLTVGEGNVFDGCIAHHNSDDGWDLFAKVQTGSIGAVTIRNSVAYANGYHLDGSGRGNGNGFKMGGDSLSGNHVLENCIAFDNKAKGIDSNSCPDIKIKNSISFNNGSYNVALYTSTAGQTNYSAEGIISFRTVNLDQDEQIKPVGAQKNDASAIFQATNYFWNATSDNQMYKSSVLGTETASYNAHYAINADMFESVVTGMDYTTHTYENAFMVTRNADNTINMNGLLVLKSGNVLGATASANIVVAPPTGDTTNIWMYVVLLVLAAGAMTATVVVSRKHN